MLKKWIEHRGCFALIWLPLLVFSIYFETKVEEFPSLEVWSFVAGMLFFILLAIRNKRVFGSKQCMYFVFLWLVATPVNAGLLLLHKSFTAFMIVELVIALALLYCCILVVTKAIPPADTVAHHPKP